jgi:hypothetical protein
MNAGLAKPIPRYLVYCDGAVEDPHMLAALQGYFSGDATNR